MEPDDEAGWLIADFNKGEQVDHRRRPHPQGTPPPLCPYGIAYRRVLLIAYRRDLLIGLCRLFRECLCSLLRGLRRESWIASSAKPCPVLSCGWYGFRTKRAKKRRFGLRLPSSRTFIRMITDEANQVRHTLLPCSLASCGLAALGLRVLRVEGPAAPDTLDGEAGRREAGACERHPGRQGRAT